MMSAVLFVDLDRFKSVNDTYGHQVGDELLVAVAQRLSEVLRPGDTLARLSGDEFVILCEDLDDPAQADAIAARIDAALAPPFFAVRARDRGHAPASASPSPARRRPPPSSILHDADMAMYQAKRAGGGRHEIFDLREQHLAEHRAGLERDLHGALGRGELYLVYQPIVATTDGRITGVEALLRWAHPSRGPVPPSVLIPLAEQIRADPGDRTMGARAGLAGPAPLAARLPCRRRRPSRSTCRPTSSCRPASSTRVAAVLPRTRTDRRSC